MPTAVITLYRESFLLQLLADFVKQLRRIDHSPVLIKVEFVCASSRIWIEVAE
jgi:hypothetical protein